MGKLLKRISVIILACAMIAGPVNTYASQETANSEDRNKKVAETMEENSTAGYLAVYTAEYEPDMGMEFAQYPSKEYTDTYRTDVLYYALSKDGKVYEPMNNNKAVMSPQNCYKMGSPLLFRKPDGTYGLIAAVDNTTDQVMIFDTNDLIYYYNQRIIKLNNNGITVMNPYVIYNNSEECYDIYWEGGDGKSYLTRSEDMLAVSEPEETSYSKSQVDAKLPDYAKEDEAAVFELTKEEYDRINNKFGNIHSVSVDIKDINIKRGEEVVLPDKADVIYSDGSKTPMNIEWDTKGLDLKNIAAGEYTVNGKINATLDYNSPLAYYRADPYAVYDEEKDVYYFTGSNMNERSASGGGAYQSIVLRQSDSINGITDADEAEVWTDRTLEDGTKITGWYWAPEIHKIGGKWRIIAQASVTEPGESSGGSRQCIFTCNGDDLTDPDNWEYTGYIHNTTDNQTVGAFDTTYFEYEGQSYYVTPKSSQIWITTVDPKDPIHPTGPLVRLSGADRAYETNNGSGKAGFGSINGMPGQAIEEASSVLIHGDKIFIVYAGCTIDMMYCVCALWTYIDEDFMNPDSWQKYPYPLLATQDLTTTLKKADYYATDGTTDVTGHGDSGLLPGSEGEYEGTFGPGHNSFTIDENGNPVIIYHARDWADSYPGATGSDKYGLVDPGRHAYARPVIFDAEGFPVCNLSPEQYLSENLRNVSVKITVSDSGSQINSNGINGDNSRVGNNTDRADVHTVKKGDKIIVKGAVYKVLNAGAQGIGKAEFAGVKKKNVKKIIVPDKIKIQGKIFKITGIGKKAFCKCRKLKKITIKATGVKSVAKNAFKGTNENLKVYVPKKKWKAYKKIFNKVHLSYK